MSTIRSLSPDETWNSQFSSHELDDHREQPEGLSVRHSSEIPPRSSVDTLSFRESPSTFSPNSQPQPRLSTDTQFLRHAEPVQGILLNSAASELERTASSKMDPNTEHTSFVYPCDEDNCSRVSFDMNMKTEEDVCFPMPQNNKLSVDIDFGKLEKFAVMDKKMEHTMRNYYKPTCSYSSPTHRPFVPQAMVHSNDDSCDKETTYVESEKKDLKLCGQLSESSMYGHGEKPSISFGVPRRNSFTMDRFSFFTANGDETVKSPDLSSLCEEGQSFENLFTSTESTWWLDCLDPTHAEMSVIAKAFGIHPLTAEDIRMRETREKVELFKNYYFVCFHAFEPDDEAEDYLEPINVYIVVFRGGILSFHFSPIQHTINVRRRIRQLRDYVKVSSDWICYALIDDITDGFAPILREIELDTDAIEDSVFIAREQDFGPMLHRIGQARKKVMTMLRLLSGKADVIKMFAKRCNERHDNAPRSEISLYLGDIQDHIVTMHQDLSVCEKIFSRSHSNYLAQLQVESVNSNNRVTKVLGRVTLIGTILVPLNLVTGLFGMNVKVPGQEVESLKWFFGIIGFIVAIIILFSLIAHRWMGEAESETKLEQKATSPSRMPRKKMGPRSIRSIRSIRS